MFAIALLLLSGPLVVEKPCDGGALSWRCEFPVDTLTDVATLPAPTADHPERVSVSKTVTSRLQYAVEADAAARLLHKFHAALKSGSGPIDPDGPSLQIRLCIWLI